MTDSRQAFTQWLQDQMGIEDLQLENWEPSESGFSNETHIFHAHYTKDGQACSKKLVHRLAPTGQTLFQEYDLARQCNVMDYVNAHSSLPLAKIVARDLAAERPHYVMEYIEGEAPADGGPGSTDSYLFRGFLAKGTPAQRGQFFTNMVSTIADVHKVPVSTEFERSFARRSPGDTPLQKEVNWWFGVYNWAKGSIDTPLSSDKYFDWTLENIPDLADRSICWGDARLANVLVNDFEVTAVLDWELASIGPGELDLFYHFMLHEIFEWFEGAPKLEGIPSEAEQIAMYEEVSGQKIRHADFFRVFAVIRCCVIYALFGKLMGGKREDLEPLDLYTTKLARLCAI